MTVDLDNLIIHGHESFEPFSEKKREEEASLIANEIIKLKALRRRVNNQEITPCNFDVPQIKVTKVVDCGDQIA